MQTQPSHDEPPQVLGLDIGGANLKLADANGRTLTLPLPMWLEHKCLATKLAQALETFSAMGEQTFNRVAVTMTGELADCFDSRRQGVMSILQQLVEASGDRRISVFGVDGVWLSVQLAIADPWRVAASNWVALAEWVLRSVAASNGRQHIDAILDIGSTTVDIIPIAEHRINTSARTDRDRLQQGQLVYTGMERTPVAAILSSLWIDDQACPVMAERFATSGDAYLVLGELPEFPDDCDTADGKPKTHMCAESRLARMIGEDRERLSEATLQDLAKQVAIAQATAVAAALLRNLSRLDAALVGHAREPGCGFETLGELPCGQVEVRDVNVLVSGHGRPMLDRVAKRLASARPDIEWRWRLLSDYTCATASRAAPAVAVAWLLTDELSEKSANPSSVGHSK